MATKRTKTATKAARKVTKRAPVETNTETRSVIKPEFRQRYGKAGNNGDETATKLAAYLKAGDGDAREKLKALAEANGLWSDKWVTLNVGMVRMNLGNRLRAAARKGQAISWLGVERLQKSGKRRP